MVKFHVIHHRRWKRPDNHLDGRRCPDCGATVHGNHGQREHARWHDELNDTLVRLCQDAGITEAELEAPWTWTAEIDEPGEDDDDDADTPTALP